MKLQICDFTYSEVNYIGHVINECGFKIDFKKIDIVQSSSIVTTLVSLPWFYDLISTVQIMLSNQLACCLLLSSADNLSKDLEPDQALRMSYKIWI